MILHQIGNQPFTILRGNPQEPTTHLEVLTRPGVNGFGVRRVGKRGRPFELTSLTDATNMTWGRLALESYVAMVGTDLYLMRKDGVLFTYPVAVLNVEQVALNVGSCIVGGIYLANGATGAILEAKWTLAFVE